MKPVKPAILPEADRPEGGSVEKSKNRFAAGICVLLTLAVFAVFGQTIRYEFVNFDDDGYFKFNHQVKAGLTWNGAQWAFRTGSVSNWHPLTWLSLMLDAQLFGTSPAGPHLMNVLLHAANAVLLFLLLRRLMGLRSNKSIRATTPQVGLGCDKSVGAVATQAGALWPSAFVAAIFAIHPLHVESVAWVSERKDVLSGLFFMLTLWAYARYAQKRSKVESRESRTQAVPAPDSRSLGAAKRSGDGWTLDYGLALLFFALGLMSKPMLVTVPFVLLLLDWWPLGRVTRDKWQVTRFRIPVPQLSAFNHLLLEKLPFFLLSAASCVATVLAQREVIKPTIVLPLTLRFGNALMAYVTYLVHMVWPDNLAAFYPYRFDVPFWQIAGAGVLLLSVTVLVLVAAKRFPYLPVGWLWYLGMLVPVIGLVQVGDQSHADRYTYLPQIGLYLVMVWAVRDFTASWRYRREVLGAVAGIVIVALIVCSWKQTAYWRNDESLWRRALVCTSGNYITYSGLGAALVDQGRFDEAIGYLLKAIEVKPNSAEVYNDWGKALMGQGQTAEAIKHFQKAVEIDPACAEAYNNLGNLLDAHGRAAEAIECYQKAIELRPNRAEIYNNFGNLLAAQNRATEAIAQYRKAVEIEPDYAKAHYNLGTMLVVQGHAAEAINQFKKALEIEPDDLNAHYNLGNALLGVGRIDEAIVQFKKALGIKPDDADTYYNLGVALVRIGRSEEAVGCFQKVIEFKPDSVGAYNNLGLVLFTQGKFAEAIKEYRRTLELKPNYADAHFMLGCALRSQREFEAAKEQFQEVLKLEPGHEMAQNRLAWLLATCPEASLRDGARAVELAREAEQLSGGKQAEVLDTLAAAYAEAGRYPEAVETARRALSLVATQNNQPLAEAIESRLKLYEANVPFHEKP